VCVGVCLPMMYVFTRFMCVFKCVYVCLSVFPMTGLLILMMCFYCVANVL